MSSTRQIKNYRFVGWVLRILAVSLALVIAVSTIESVPTITASSSAFYSAWEEVIFVLLGVVVITWFSEHMFRVASDQDKSINERLMGFVMSAETVTFDELGAWVRITQVEVADRLGRIASKGGLKDYLIDLSNRVVTRAPKQAVPLGPRPTTQVSPAQASEAPPMGAEPDDVIRIKAKLYELEVLKQQGKIGQPAYDKLKEEYEKKLAQSDKGTQVY